MSSSTAGRSATTLRLLSIPIVAAIVVAGVWVAGGVITDNFRVSMALTTVWFLLCGAASVVVAIRVPALRISVPATFVVVSVAVGGFLGLTTLRDKVVDEQVVTGVPLSEVSAAAPAPEPAEASQEAAAAPKPKPQPRDVQLSQGSFISGEHVTTGTASIVRLASGKRYLTLTSFSTSAGPDLRVRLVSGDSHDGNSEGSIDLGALKGNRGDQQYDIPDGARTSNRTVVIWCRAFSVSFGSARLA